MYKFLWSKLPGSNAVKFVQVLVAIIVVLIVLFTYAFPILENIYLETGVV